MLPDTHCHTLAVQRRVTCVIAVSLSVVNVTVQISKLPNVEIVPVTAFRLAPANNRGIYSLDGERIPTEPVQVEVVRGALRMYGFEKSTV